jgi:CO dehydrogenase/acetyl-CoA synthase delta subunit
MENTKATSILNDIMEKLSLVKKDEVKEVEVNQEVNLSEEVKEEEKLSQELTELACQEEEVKEELSSEEVVAEDLQEEVPVIEEASEEIEMDETKYVSKDEFESKISELKGMIEEMKLGYGEEKLSMQKEIEKLSAEPASEPISHNPEGEVKQNFKSFGQNRVMNTRDRVMNRIANLK